MFLQNNAKTAENKINKLTAFYLQPPVMPKSNIRVEGEDDPRMTSAGVNYDQQILDKTYYKNIAKFNTASQQQKQYLERLDRQNMTN